MHKTNHNPLAILLFLVGFLVLFVCLFVVLWGFLSYLYSQAQQGHSCLTKQASKHPLGASQETPSISLKTYFYLVLCRYLFFHIIIQPCMIILDYKLVAAAQDQHTQGNSSLAYHQSELLLLRKMQEFQCLQLN